MLSIGIGGNIGSGKTTVTKELVKLYQKDGVKVKLIDADTIAWKLYKRESGSKMYKNIVKAFGNDMLDKKNEINRKKLGVVVFSDKKMLEILNKIVHPELVSRIKDELRKTDTQVKMLDAALLFLWGNKIPVNYRILVTAGEKQKVARTIKCGYNAIEVKARLKRQMSESEMEKMADFVINNNGNLKTLKSKLCFLYNEIFRL